MELLLNDDVEDAGQGEILLAISAWHLYPNLITKPEATHVSQEDILFRKGGALTINLGPPQLLETGLTWTLHLRHLRYYGKPVEVTRTIGFIERTRVSVLELALVLLGRMLAGWGRAALDTQRVARWLAAASDLAHQEAAQGSASAQALVEGPASLSWLELLFRSAQAYCLTDADGRVLAEKLIEWGRVEGESFLGIPSTPLFGLISHGRFVRLIKKVEDQIQYLRKTAQLRFEKLYPYSIMIRYKHEIEVVPKPLWEFATALPFRLKSKKRSRDDEDHLKHWRWIGGEISQDRNRIFANMMYDQVSPDMIELIREDLSAREERYSQAGEVVRREWPPFIYDNSPHEIQVQWGNAVPRADLEEESPLAWNASLIYESYSYFYGDDQSAALFIHDDLDIPAPSIDRESMELLSLFDTQEIDALALVDGITENLHQEDPHTAKFSRCAKGIATVASLYDGFSHTLNSGILLADIANSEWVRTAQDHPSNQRQNADMIARALLPYTLDRCNAFACITFCETGGLEPSPTRLEDVVAISSEDSIFFPSALLTDVVKGTYNSGEMTRIRGNIGHPGVCLLRLPVQPSMRDLSKIEWSDIDLKTFHGEIKDTFEATSLRLSFTGYTSREVRTVIDGQDNEITSVATVLSVFDGDDWIADINPGRSLASNLVHLIKPCTNKYRHPENMKPSLPLLSAETWLELLIKVHAGSKIVQSKGNRDARLAATCISEALGLNTFVLPEDPCWGCIEEKMDEIPGPWQDDDYPVLIG